jgi:hypothetical protein
VPLQPGSEDPVRISVGHELLPRRPHRFGERLLAPLQLGSHPGRQIRISSLAHLGGHRHEPLVVIPVALGAGVPDAAYDGERVGADGEKTAR